MWSVPDVKHVSGTYHLNLGGPGRNRTTDTRIFNSPPKPTFAFDLKGLSHQPQLVKKFCVLVPVKFD